MLFGLVVLTIIIVICFVFFNLKKKNLNLQGKHVMISGGSSGIGLSAAQEVLLQGANVTLVARSEAKLKEAKDQLQNGKKSAGSDIYGKVQTFSADVAAGKAVLKEVVESAEDNFGPVHMLINCAGYARAAKFEDISESSLKGMMDVNFMGAFHLSQLVVQSMKRAGEGGSIVFFSSLVGQFGFFGYTAYAACKAALIKMAEALHMELKPHDISVTVCCPPDTDTPGLAEENKTKPAETLIISEAADVWQPKLVGKRLVEDAISRKFYSCVGLDGFMITTLCTGMGPVTDALSLFAQVFLSGVFRLVSCFYLWKFGQIVIKESEKKQLSKKAE